MYQNAVRALQMTTSISQDIIPASDMQIHAPFEGYCIENSVQCVGEIGLRRSYFPVSRKLEKIPSVKNEINFHCFYCADKLRFHRLRKFHQSRNFHFLIYFKYFKRDFEGCLSTREHFQICSKRQRVSKNVWFGRRHFQTVMCILVPSSQVVSCSVLVP